MMLENQSLGEYTRQLAARTSTPGGGAAAAVTAAQACALIQMVANFSDDCADISERAAAVSDGMLAFADDDAKAFKAVMAAYKGKADLEGALVNAALVPAQIIKCCAPLLADLERLETHGNQNLITDVGIAALLLHSALHASVLNILINTRAMQAEVDPAIDSAKEQAEALATQMLTLATRTKTSLQ